MGVSVSAGSDVECVFCVSDDASLVCLCVCVSDFDVIWWDASTSTRPVCVCVVVSAVEYSCRRQVRSAKRLYAPRQRTLPLGRGRRQQVATEAKEQFGEQSELDASGQREGALAG